MRLDVLLTVLGVLLSGVASVVAERRGVIRLVDSRFGAGRITICVE